MNDIDHRSTVPRELVHRAAISEVLVTSLDADREQARDGRFAVGAQLPRSHAYFGDHTATPRRYDPLLVMEAARQAAIAVSHRFLGAPVDHAFLVRTFNGAGSPGPGWDIGDAPADVRIEVQVTESFVRADVRTGVAMVLTVLRGGEVMMVVDGSFSWTDPTTWGKIRRSARTGRGLTETGTPLGTGARARPEQVGRRDRANVVIGPPAIDGDRSGAELAVDLSHPTLFDHPLDHAPGNLLIEAARQLVTARALARGAGVRIDSVESTFAGFVELDLPAECCSEVTEDADGGTRAVCTIHQDGLELAHIVIRGRVETCPPRRLGFEETLTSTRAFRRGLDLTRPVRRSDLEECLDLAVHAPTGSNRQAWRFLVLDDPEVTAEVAEFYRKGFADNMAGSRPTAAQRAELASAQHLADHLHEVPVLVLACQLGRMPAAVEPRRSAGFYGSIFPAVWSLMLALRRRGLGSILTTAHLAYEREVAELLGIPYDEVTQVALVPVAHLSPGTGGRSRREPAERVTCWNGWSSAP